MQDFTIWGGSGYMLKVLHGAPPAGGGGVVLEAAAAADPSTTFLLPYWACFALISLGVRFALIPLVVQGAKTSSRFAKVVPEVQFLLSLFVADRKKQIQDGAPFSHKLALLRTNFQTLSGIYRLHKIHPFAVFWSPLLQLPVFWYVSIDLRKIVNGLDPLLAQDLVEASVAWIPDLTEPDPWFGLPILAGVLMYANVEVALGRRSLSGPAAAKSDTALLVKDFFQSFAVFMPCFTSQLPGGVQIYLVTSFAFTCAQSAALRTESIRNLVGLPSMLAPPSLEAPKYAQEFIDLKKLEQKAIEMRGSGPVLGKGVLAANLQVSFPGERRKSTIRGSGLGAVNVSATPMSEPFTA
jgi:membrane protein insertase Oxa1/YidC/SpoIIIJ